MEKLGLKIEKNEPFQRNFLKYLALLEENLSNLEPLKDEFMLLPQKANSRDQERPRKHSMYQKNIREELARGNNLIMGKKYNKSRK